MANMQEIAGVSLGTVSHVLNNTANVREPKCTRVLEDLQTAGISLANWRAAFDATRPT